MARTNWRSTFEAPHHVALSLRGNHPNLIEPDPGFVYLDSGFFGNIFTSPASLYACTLPTGHWFPEVFDRGRFAGSYPEYFPGFLWGGTSSSLLPQNCWGFIGGDYPEGVAGVCNAQYDGFGTIPESDANDLNQGVTYDRAILSTCTGGGETWGHPIFTTLDSLTE
jgi:hypothetical protein